MYTFQWGDNKQYILNDTVGVFTFLVLGVVVWESLTYFVRELTKHFLNRISVRNFPRDFKSFQTDFEQYPPNLSGLRQQRLIFFVVHYLCSLKVSWGTSAQYCHSYFGSCFGTSLGSSHYLEHYWLPGVKRKTLYFLLYCTQYLSHFGSLNTYVCVVFHTPSNSVILAGCAVV